MIKLVKMQGKKLEDYKHIGLANWGDVVLEPVKCEVFKEDNGQYYLSAELPIEYSGDIQQGDIIIVKLPILEEQCFIVNNKFETRRRIYIDNAKHISFLSDFILCTGGLALTAELIEKKLDRFVEGTVLTNKSNIESTAMYLDKFEYARLTDVLETIAKTANLHIIRDNLQIGLTDKIGQDRGLIFKYDKNIKEFKRIENWDDVVTELNYTSSENDVYVNENGEKEYFKYIVEHDYPIEYKKFKTFSLSPYSADEVQHLDDLLNKDAGTKEGAEDGGYYKLIDNLRQKIEDKKDEIEDKKDEIRTAKEELEDLKDKLSTEKDTLIDKQIALDWHVMYVESLGKTEEEYDGGVTYKFLKGEYDYQKGVCDKIKEQITEKKKEIKTLNAELDKLRQTDFSGMKATISDYKSLCKATEKEIARIKVEDCDEQAKQYISEHRVPEVTYYVDGYLQKDEYVDIGDTVKIINKDTNTNLTANVTSFKYDCIAKKYKSVVFGNIKRISDALNDFAIGFNKDTDISFYPVPPVQEEEKLTLEYEMLSNTKTLRLFNPNATNVTADKITVRWDDGTEDVYENVTNVTTIKKVYSEYVERHTVDIIFENLSTAWNLFAYETGRYTLIRKIRGKFTGVENVTDFSYCFAGNSLEEISENIFENCVNVENFWYTFNGAFSETNGTGAMKEIPSKLFENCKKVKSFYGCFNNCDTLESIPYDLFYSCPEVTDFSQCFNDCRNVKAIPENLFDKSINAKDFSGCFQNTSSVTSLPGGLFKNCVNAKWFSYTFKNGYYNEESTNYKERHSRISEISADLFKNVKNATAFDNCFDGSVSLETIPIDLFDYLNNPSTFEDCFLHCKNLKGNVRNLSTLYPDATTTGAYFGCNVTQIDK